MSPQSPLWSGRRLFSKNQVLKVLWQKDDSRCRKTQSLESWFRVWPQALPGSPPVEEAAQFYVILSINSCQNQSAEDSEPEISWLWCSFTCWQHSQAVGVGLGSKVGTAFWKSVAVICRGLARKELWVAVITCSSVLQIWTSVRIGGKRRISGRK